MLGNCDESSLVILWFQKFFKGGEYGLFQKIWSKFICKKIFVKGIVVVDNIVMVIVVLFLEELVLLREDVVLFLEELVLLRGELVVLLIDDVEENIILVINVVFVLSELSFFSF